MESYNPRPVFALIAAELSKAIKNKDWKLVEVVCLRLKKLSAELNKYIVC